MTSRTQVRLSIFVAITAIMMIGAGIAGSPAIYAKKKHKSAEQIGEEDSQSCNDNDCKGLYISQPGKGFGDHSPEFNHNYIKGFCKHQPPGTGSDEDQATLDCP